MVVANRLDSIPPEGLKPPAMQDASISEGDFAQMLRLTGDPAESLASIRVPEAHSFGGRKPSNIVDEAGQTDITALLLTSGTTLITSPLVGVVSTPAAIPAFLEGGRELLLRTGDASQSSPASMFSTHTATIKQSSVEFITNKFIFVGSYKDDLSKVQENSININLLVSESQGQPDPVAAVPPANPFAVEVYVQENDENLIISRITDDLPVAMDAGGIGAMLSQAPPGPRKESQSVALQKVETKLPAEQPLFHPALHLSQAHPTGADQAAAQTVSYDAHLHEQIAQLIERLVIHREERLVHFHLEPPELGALEIRIRLEGSTVHAWLTAERDLTRQSLEQQVQQLREQLASRGLQLAHFEVHTGSQGAFERARHFPPPPLPHSEPTPRPLMATDSLHLFGQWSAWA